MRALVTAIEEGSLSAAARRLNITQPALSQTIRSLERQLGVTLLKRSNTGIQVTENGAILLADARAILARHDQAVARVVTSSDGGHGALRLGVPVEFPSGVLADALAEFVAAPRASGVQIRNLLTSRQIAALQSDELDLGLVRDRPVGWLSEVTLVSEEQLGVLLSRADAERIGGPAGIRLDQLVGLDWVGFPRESSPAWHDEITATLRANGVQPAITYEQSPTGVFKVAVVSMGDAFALVPARGYRGISNSVTWLPIDGPPLVRRTWAAWPARSRRTDLALFIDSLRRFAYRAAPDSTPTQAS